MSLPFIYRTTLASMLSGQFIRHLSITAVERCEHVPHVDHAGDVVGYFTHDDLRQWAMEDGIRPTTEGAWERILSHPPKGYRFEPTGACCVARFRTGTPLNEIYAVVKA